MRQTAAAAAAIAILKHHPRRNNPGTMVGVGVADRAPPQQSTGRKHAGTRRAQHNQAQAPHNDKQNNNDGLRLDNGAKEVKNRQTAM